MYCPSCSHKLVNLDLTFGYCSNCLYEFDDFDLEVVKEN